MHRITVRNMKDFNTIYKKGISSSVLELHQSKSEICFMRVWRTINRINGP